MIKLVRCFWFLSALAAMLAAQTSAHAKDAPLYALDRGDPKLSTQGKFVDERVSWLMHKSQLPLLSAVLATVRFSRAQPSGD